MKNIIITGGGMGNKGAQSMTFITVDELKKRYPGDRIVLMAPMVYDCTPYKFDILRVSHRSMNYLLRPVNFLRAMLKRVRMNEVKKLDALLKNARMVVDISGYALGSNWADAIVEYYLTAFECAKKYEVPVYVMPQSFGPFQYEGERVQKWMPRIRETMSYPKLVFAREQEGYQLMKEQFALENLHRSCDMVLMNKGVDPASIYKNYTGIAYDEIMPGSVAILPNMRNFDHGDRAAIMSFYKNTITWLREKGRTVYLMHHSSEDAPICKEIKQLFELDANVRLLDTDFDCFAYEAVVRKFDYIIASRYHSIIHALRNGIPCIALGWAVKYADLLALFGQKEYMFDVRHELDEIAVFEKLEKMEQRHQEESKAIRLHLTELQKDNLFDRIAALEA